jgi:hypothetical protein
MPAGTPKVTGVGGKAIVPVEAKHLIRQELGLRLRVLQR